MLSIEEVDHTCHDLNSQIKMRLVFENLSKDNINLPDEFSIALNRRGDGGNIVPFITDIDGTDLRTPADFSLVDFFNTPSIGYYQLPANQIVVFVVEYRFPSFLSQIMENKTINLVTSKPGQYLIRFVYFEHQRDVDTWYGAIGSNQIEICIIS